MASRICGHGVGGGDEAQRGETAGAEPFELLLSSF